MTEALKTTKKTFEALQVLHAVLGTMPCTWEAYRAEMVSTYKLDGATLDSFARLGHLQVSDKGVSFHA